ncbi:MAG: hypothetical protein JNL83_20175 [Myxococcales bacterium]|nr:hypothetical protein [Myxococcales bacterium]
MIQVERCEVVLLVGYRPGTGEPTEAILGRASTAPKSRAREALQELMAAFAMAPLTVSVDGQPLVPTAVRAKIGLEPGGARPMVVVLVTYPLPAGKSLSVASQDPRSTRLSWQRTGGERVAISDAPQQGKWYPGVASMLLPLAAGATPCDSTTPSSLPSSPSRLSR